VACTSVTHLNLLMSLSILMAFSRWTWVSWFNWS